MAIILDTLFLAMLVIALHVSSMAGSAKAFGVTIRRIVCGYGPAVYQSSLFQVRLIPWGGYVKLKDSRDENLNDDNLKDAFDRQPAITQAAIPIAGPLALLLVSLAILGKAGWTAFVSGFGQLFAGAISPFSVAQALLHSFVLYLPEHSSLAALGLLCAKVAAFNALPIPVLNGGQALMAMARITGSVHAKLQQAGILISFALSASWITALVYYVWRAAI